MLVIFTHQIVYNNTFYKIKLLMRFRIINAQPTRKQQLIYLNLKIIRYYRLTITRDKFHEVIQMSMGLIQYSYPISGVLMNVVANLCSF